MAAPAGNTPCRDLSLHTETDLLSSLLPHPNPEQILFIDPGDQPVHETSPSHRVKTSNRSLEKFLLKISS
jgi:hypothetical protein